MSVRAASRYAKAFLEFSNEKKSTVQVSNDLKFIQSTISKNAELSLFLENPIVNDASKVDSLNQIFSSISEDTKNLLQLLVQNKRVSILGEIALQFKKLYDKQEGKEVAYVTIASAMSPDLETKILAKAKEISSSVVSLECKIDISLIGGFVIRIGDQQIDTSISTKINNLKNTFVQ